MLHVGACVSARHILFICAHALRRSSQSPKNVEFHARAVHRTVISAVAGGYRASSPHTMPCRPIERFQMLFEGLGCLVTCNHKAFVDRKYQNSAILTLFFFLAATRAAVRPLRPAILQLRAEVKSIDNKLTTTSMKLVEEKTLLRRKDVIKARLKELVVFETSLQKVQVLKVGRTFLFICWCSTRVTCLPHTNVQRDPDTVQTPFPAWVGTLHLLCGYRGYLFLPSV